MLKVSLEHRSPLQGFVRAGRTGRMSDEAGVIVREIKEFDAVQIAARRGKAAEVVSILSASVGADVADKPGRVAGNGLAIVGLAPGQWFAVARGTNTDRLHALRDRLAGFASVSDQGAGKIMLEVSGSQARNTLCKGIAVDLDPVAFKVGSSAQTVVAHIGVQISLLDAAPTFELITAGSTAGSFWAWLSSSAREYGVLVT